MASESATTRQMRTCSLRSWWQRLVQKYRSMSELLRKVEEAVLGSVSGTAPALAQYYAHWERAVFHALNALTLGGMTSLQRMLEGVSPANPGPHASLFEVRKIFVVAAILRRPPSHPPGPVSYMAGHHCKLCMPMAGHAEAYLH